MGVKLGDEKRGYTRFRFLSELLAREGFDVDLITSSFQHWEKAHRDCAKACYQGLPYRIVFIDEPGYTRNLDLGRIRSHRVAAKNLRAHFEQKSGAYDLIYAEIPPNDVARACAEAADAQSIPFVADINDLWPEAMRMVVNVPLISDLAFYPFTRDAKRVYQLLSAAVGTSDEYAARPALDRDKPYPRSTVYVGNDLAVFDEGARTHASDVSKPKNEIWVTYAGTLGASYDVKTLVEAAALLEQERLGKSSTDETRNAQGETDFSTNASDCVNKHDAWWTSRPSKGVKHVTAFASWQGKPAPSDASAPLKFGLSPALPPIRVKVLGDGPDRAKLEARAKELNAPVDFLGYTDYQLMAAYLCASDIVVNSLVKSAAQSIVTKIGDYLASGKPMINTGSSPEFRSKVSTDGFGVNVEAENPRALANQIAKLSGHASLRKIMGSRARMIAEKEFDQPQAYQRIVDLLRTLL